MIRRFMVFASMLAGPVSAMICSYRLLPFFAFFPVISLLGGKWRYLKSLFFFVLPPLLLLVWAALYSNDYAVLRAARWVSAVAAGTYFATALGAPGVSSVLRSISSVSFTEKLSDLIDSAGDAASNAKRFWSENSLLPLSERILKTVHISLDSAKAGNSAPREVEDVSVFAAVLSWSFFLFAVSGIASV